jgi:dUTP pyrophosphatase
MIFVPDLKVNFKKLQSDAVIPKYAHSTDAGLDMTAYSFRAIEEYDPSQNMSIIKYIEYTTGIALEIPTGHVGLIYPRSSISNYDLILSNSVGVIDSSYRGEIRFRFRLTKPLSDAKIYQIGDRIGQLMIIPFPKICLNEVNELNETDRGKNGFGSTSQ